MLRVLTARCCSLRPITFLNRYPIASPSLSLLSPSYYSSQPKKPLQKPGNSNTNAQQKLTLEDIDPNDLLNTAAPPAFAIYRPNKGNGVAFRCGFAMDRVYLHLAREKSQGVTTPGNRREDELDSSFDWEGSTLATMLNMYDVSKILAVLEGREQRAEVSTTVEGEDGQPIYKLTVLVTPSAASASSAATSTSSWRALYSVHLAARYIRQDASIPSSPEVLSVSLDAGEVYTFTEHLRRSLVKMFGFDNTDFFDEDDEDVEDQGELERLVQQTKNQVRKDTKTFLNAVGDDEGTRNRPAKGNLEDEDDEIKKFLNEIDHVSGDENDVVSRKVIQKPKPKPRPTTLGATKSTLKKPQQ